MDEATRRETYERAIALMARHMEKDAKDGTWHLTMSGDRIGIDPVVFADLERSLEETNRKIRLGIIEPDEIKKPDFLLFN